MKTWLNVKFADGKVTATACASTQYGSAVTGEKAEVVASLDMTASAELAAALQNVLEAAGPFLARKLDHDRAVHLVHEPNTKAGKGVLRKLAEAVGLAKE